MANAPSPSLLRWERSFRPSASLMDERIRRLWAACEAAALLMTRRRDERLPRRLDRCVGRRSGPASLSSKTRRGAGSRAGYSGAYLSHHEGAAVPAEVSQTSQVSATGSSSKTWRPWSSRPPDWRPSRSPLRWTLQEYSSSRGRVGWPRTSGQVTATVAALLHATGLQSAGQPKDARGGFSSRPQRAQFEHISKKVRTFQTQQQPVVSVLIRKRRNWSEISEMSAWNGSPCKGRRTRSASTRFKDKELGKSDSVRHLGDITNNEGQG